MRIKAGVLPPGFYIRSNLTHFEFGGFDPDLLGKQVLRVVEFATNKTISPERASTLPGDTPVVIWGIRGAHGFNMYLSELEIIV